MKVWEDNGCWGGLSLHSFLGAAKESFPGLDFKEYTFHLGNKFRNVHGNLQKQEEAYVEKAIFV